MRAIPFILFFLISGILSAQNFNINLSQEHLSKLERYKSGHKRLRQYYKFYRKDSLDHSRKQNQKYKKELDSIGRANLKRDKLRRRFTRNGITFSDDPVTLVDSLDNEIKHCWKTLTDSSSSDSIKLLAKKRARSLVVQKAKLGPGYEQAINKSVDGDSSTWQDLVTGIPGLDTLSALFNSSTDEFFATIEQTAESGLTERSSEVFGTEFNEAVQLKDLPDRYRQQFEAYGNKDSLQHTAAQMATAEAIRQFQNNAPIGEAQQQVSRLLSKYQQFANSSDLSTATKNTSMKGKSPKEHLVVGGNFNIVSTHPFSIDLSPQIGYKLTTQFSIGIGANYRHTFGDSIRSGHYISPHNSSYKAFVVYNVTSSFFAQVEWERSSIKIASTERITRQWRDNFFVGAGKRFLVHPKLYFTVTGFYNLNSEDQNPIHPSRFQLRLGFHVSELAMRKPNVSFQPNR